MRIFLSGGTGFIGGHLRRALLAAGHQVRVMVHRRGERLEPGIETVDGDVTDAGSIAPSIKGCDAVINLIGIIREFPDKGVTFEKLHPQATRALLAAASASGVRRFLQMSALGTRPHAVSRYHLTKFQAEEAVRGSGLDYTIFRPSVVFGPGDAFVNMLAGYIRDYPAVPVIGDGRYRMQPIAVEDVVRCFVSSLDRPDTVGKAFELCGPDRMSYDDMLDTIGAVLGKKVVKLHSPLALMKLVVPFLQRFPAFPLTIDQLRMLVEENICDGRWRETFGFPPTPFREGIARYLGR